MHILKAAGPIVLVAEGDSEAGYTQISVVNLGPGYALIDEANAKLIVKQSFPLSEPLLATQPVLAGVGELIAPGERATLIDAGWVQELAEPFAAEGRGRASDFGDLELAIKAVSSDGKHPVTARLQVVLVSGASIARVDPANVGGPRVRKL